MKEIAGLVALMVILVSLSLVSPVLAHAPLGTGDDERIATATVIPDPTESWALYPL